MNKPLLILLAALLPYACTAPHPATLKAISYNIRLGTADDGPHSWPHRQAATLRMIEQEQPDLLGIQEGLIDQVRYIERNCPAYARLGVGRDDGQERGEIMALFYRRDRFELLGHGDFWLSETPDTVSRGWDAACNRTVTWGCFRDRCTERTVCYFNTHLDHLGPTAREQSIRLIAARIGERAPQGAAVILGGDFNSPTDAPIFRPLDSLLRSARDTSPRTDRKPTFTDYGRATRPQLLDHLYFANATPLSFRTLDGDYGAPYISDHYPVEAVLQL